MDPSDVSKWLSSERTLKHVGDAEDSVLLERLRLAHDLMSEMQKEINRPSLLYRQGTSMATYAPVREGLIVGRSGDCDLRLEDTSLSREHFEVRLEEGQSELIDLKSRNGTRVNGDIVSRKVLVSGDVIEAGSFFFIYIDPFDPFPA